MQRPLWQHDATELAPMLASGAVSAREVLEEVLTRIDVANHSVNAVVDDLRDEARAAADAADRAQAAGEPLRPLHGIPVTTKINVDTKGRPTDNGLPAFSGLIAPEDSAVVKHLRDAGAIIVGRTNAPEISMRVTTDNPIYGATKNPWNSELSPGGSSGGAGVAAACGFGTIHHGNDIGGSLRLPAFANGVTTIKPTQGRIASYSPTAAAERGLMAVLMSSQGAIARSVADVRLATQVMSGSDHRDPWWVPAPWDGPALASPITVAVSKESYGSTIDPAIAAAIDRAAAVLDEAGYRVVEVMTPSIPEATAGWLSTGVTELKLTLDQVVRKFGSADLQQVFDGFYDIGTILDLSGYRAGLSDRTRMLREWAVFLEEHPILLCPYLLRPMFPARGDLDGNDGLRDIIDSMKYSLAFNVLGLPAGVLPIDTAPHQGAQMPVGVQFIGRRFREDLVLDTMAVVESAINASTGRVVDRLW